MSNLWIGVNEELGFVTKNQNFIESPTDQLTLKSSPPTLNVLKHFSGVIEFILIKACLLSTIIFPYYVISSPFLKLCLVGERCTKLDPFINRDHSQSLLLFPSIAATGSSSAREVGQVGPLTHEHTFFSLKVVYT